MKSDGSGRSKIEPTPGFALAFGFGPTLQALLIFQLGGINLFWSSIFGIGGHMVEWIDPAPHVVGSADLFGVVVWPILMWIALYRVGDWISRLPVQQARIATGIYSLSLCIIVPLEGIITTTIGTAFKYECLPLYIRLLAY